MKPIVAFALLLFLTPTLLSKDRAWQDGKLTDISRRSAVHTKTDRILGGIDSEEKIMFEYTIRIGNKFYVAELPPLPRAGGFLKNTDPMDLDINATIKFAIEKKDLYLLDKKNKERKLHIIKQGNID